MNKLEKIYSELKKKGLSPEQEELILREMKPIEKHIPAPPRDKGLYDTLDFDILPGYFRLPIDSTMAIKTLEELLEQDKKREEDGFPRRIRIGKYVKPAKGNKGEIVVVPTTTEPKFYHDDSITEDQEDESTGGSGEGEDGEVIGEQQAQPQQGEGEGQGAGEGSEGDHDVSSEAFDLGKVLTEKFQLPNLKNKGSKRAFSKYIYDLTDRNRGFGQVLEKKETLKRIIETNIQLGRISGTEPIDTEDLLINPQDEVYRILSKEKDFETQAVVFFLRDYSGSMQGKPTEVVAQQHLFIYSWLMYQYHNNVMTRFILHDTEAKEAEDFHTYHQSQVAGGTKIAPAFQLVNKIVEDERLASQYNVYVFHGTDGDDWDESGKETMTAIEHMLGYANRVGITVAKNSWARGSKTTVEKYMEGSGLLKSKPELFKLDSMDAASADENRIIQGIKNLIG
jgi:uncharacterized sporulation protein YeaH/YhbH (DUF444 family)